MHLFGNPLKLKNVIHSLFKLLRVPNLIIIAATQYLIRYFIIKPFLAVNNFVWKAMNSWYNWKDEVPNLADTKDDVLDTYYTYLNSFKWKRM